MIRFMTTVLASVALLVVLYSGVYRMVTADAHKAMASPQPELEWLRREYTLNDKQFTAIKTKHEAHDVICKKLCFDLVTAQNKLDQAITNYPKMGPEVQTALAEWSAQREICREAAIQHMYDISAVLEADEAANYRKRIYERLIVPGRMPHIDLNGKFRERLIEHAAPSAEAPVSANE